MRRKFKMKWSKEVAKQKEIDAHMLETIRKLADFNREAINSRSLVNAKLGAKKRTRKQREKEQELSTRLNIRRDKEMAQFVADPNEYKRTFDY